MAIEAEEQLKKNPILTKKIEEVLLENISFFKVIKEILEAAD